MCNNTGIERTKKEEKENIIRGIKTKRIIAKRLEESLLRTCDDIAWKECLDNGTNPDEVKIQLYSKMLKLLFDYEKQEEDS